MEAEESKADAQAKALNSNQVASATKEADEKAKALADAQKDYSDTVLPAWQKAQTDLENARKAAEEAAQELAEVQSLMTRGTTHVQQLQNSQINLKLRIESGTQGQTDCFTQHGLCYTANEELQNMPNDDVVQVNTAYEKVKTLSKKTTYHERQVREASQQMKAVQKQLDDVNALFNEMERPTEQTEQTEPTKASEQVSKEKDGFKVVGSKPDGTIGGAKAF
jgi:HD-GYP domain-containing protein (c-di-GMP phosphodiesterase class II)